MTTTISLYEHETRLREAHEALSAAMDDGQEIPADALTVIEEYALAAESKRDACAAVLRSLEADEGFIEQEIARLRAIKGRRIAARERLESYILATMRAHQVDKLKGVTSVFAVRQNPQSLEVSCGVDDLPVEFVRETVSRTPDKLAMKAALKQGRVIPNVRLVDGDYRLDVR